MTTNATGTGTGTEQARQFLRGVEAACADLAPTERSRLLTGLDEHLSELSADGVDLTAELGDPADYARELRATAGMPVAAGPWPGSTAAAGFGEPSTGAEASGREPAIIAGRPAAARLTGPGISKPLLVGAGILGAIAVAFVLLSVLGGLALLAGNSSSAAAVPVLNESSTVTVPNTSGLTELEARRVLTEAGLTFVITTVVTSPPAGSVLAQDPAAGTSVEPGATIRLTVSSVPPKP